MLTLAECRIAVIGLGYVGLPLAAEFGRRYPTIGFDVNAARVAALRRGEDVTRELTSTELRNASQLQFTNDAEALQSANVYIVTVPTPIDRHKRPDISALRKASATIGRVISPGNIVIYESTVYPGATEDDCVPIIEAESGLGFNREFFAGYSPERINPGDREHRLTSITKVTSGSTPEVADLIDELYGSIIAAGTHKAPSIRVAEAAKVIENTQRDLNIALMNELAVIFHRMDIDTAAVLEAAGTKWNFLNFKPGLVGGHCIGVDPYYLTHKSEELGYHPEVILAGRRINDAMGEVVANRVIKLMLQRRIELVNASILVLGFTFKENCPDVRNTRVIDVVRALASYQAQVAVHDPWADPAEVAKEYGITMIPAPEVNAYDAVILCVGHQQFVELDVAQMRHFGKSNCVLFDVKSVLPADASDGRL